MAKKKTVKKSKQREKTKPKQANARVPKKTATKAKATKPRITSPRSVPLPGMEQVTNRTLNRICEQLSDCRRELNRAKQDETVLADQAASVMANDNVPSYTHSGVRLTLHAGVTRLSIKLVDEEATAKRPAKKDTGSGQDAAAIAETLTDPDEDREGVDAADEEAKTADLEG